MHCQGLRCLVDKVKSLHEIHDERLCIVINYRPNKTGKLITSKTPTKEQKWVNSTYTAGEF